MALFGKKIDGGRASVFSRDPRKAKRFFDHAKVVGGSRNYDYAIDCYINGLRHNPDNMDIHKSLHEVALKRKASGGKPARLTEKFRAGGKDVIDKLLHTEMLWSKDPQNLSLMADLMGRAVEADLAHDGLHLAELARWVGSVILESKQTSNSSAKAVYTKATNLFTEIHAFGQAVEACTVALRLDPDNHLLAKQLKDLEAERAMQEGGYTSQNIRSQNFQGMVKDIDKQRQLQRDDAITVRGSALDEEIRTRRTQYNEAPEDIDRLGKLVAALVRKESDEAEEEAISLLDRASQLTGQYRYKMRTGDIRMKQINRRLRRLQAAAKSHPQDAEIKSQVSSLTQQKLQFELEEYTERTKHYPTDLSLRYELGRRLLALQHYDEAIASFQQSKADPKHRIVSMDHLGRCYTAKGWFEEAIDTLRQGIEDHPRTDDRLALEMRYQLLLALKRLAIKDRSVQQAKEAQKIASHILQTDINFRDIRQQMDVVRKLVSELAAHP